MEREGGEGGGHRGKGDGESFLSDTTKMWKDGGGGGWRGDEDEEKKEKEKKKERKKKKKERIKAGKGSNPVPSVP